MIVSSTSACIPHSFFSCTNSSPDNSLTGKIQYTDADAIAAQAREIIRTTNTQLKIAAATNRGVPKEVISFSETD